MRRLPSLFASFASALVAALVWVAPVGAQSRPGGVQPMARGGGGGGTTPWTEWSDPSGPWPTTYDQYPLLRFYWCDNFSLVPGTRWVKVNGVLRTSSFDYTTEAPSGSCAARASSQTTTVPLNLGSNSVETYICDDEDLGPYCGYTMWNVTRLSPPVPVVTPDSSQVSSSPIVGARRRFTISHGDVSPHTYNLSTSCIGAVSGCVAPTQVTVYPSTDVYVTYNVEGSGGPTGTITLIAADVVSGAADTGVVAVTYVRPAPVIARDLCLTVAVGQSAASECGDLRIVHPLPTVRTLGKARTPTLIYNSQHARPRPIVATNVTLTSAADSVVAALTVGGLAAQSRSWSGSQFPTGAARRVGVVYDPGSTQRTGLYPYTLEVRRYTGGSPAIIATISDTLAVVNRDSSAFGAGWWLAGLEQLFFPPAGGILWVGGDGSVRRYRSVGSNAYVAPPLDHPDTLLYRPGDATYVRILPGGDSVVFAANGLHARTVNRLGYRTEFLYMGDGSNRLWKIRVPPQLDSLVYTFTYGSSTGRLSQVTAPDTAGGSGRITNIGTTDMRITSIQDPGSSATVQFGYGTGADIRRITSRTNRRGAATFYEFDAASRLRESKLGLSAAANDTIRTTFEAIAETRGLSTQDAAAPDRDSVFTRLDGPRTDSADVSTFWVTPYNGVRHVRDPYGYVTTVSRADPRWPALATRTQAPSGRIVSASYDARGNLAAVADSNPYGNGLNPTTQYQWDQRWDELTLLTLPNGQITVFNVNAANGNVNYVEDARGSVARTTFTYVPSGNGAGLVQTVVAPGGATTTFAYDWRGNVDSSQAPLGWPTVVAGDRLGRPRVAKTPLGPLPTSNAWRTDTTAFDTRDRVIRTASVGDAMSGVPVQTLTARYHYDEEGNRDSVVRTQSPDLTSIGSLVTRWAFDAANRPTVEIAPDGYADSTWYDLAGNVTSAKSRRGHVLTMAYDRVNRLRRRTVPAVTYPQRTSPGLILQTPLPNDPYGSQPHPYPWFPNAGGGLRIDSVIDTFVYDSGGNLIQADNADARVRRAYFKDGNLQTDSLSIRNYSGSTFSHVYGLRYTYDVNGRLMALRHPSQLASGAGMRDSVRNVYNDTTGALAQVTSLLGNQIQFRYNARGELIRDSMPGGIVDSLAYDDLGRPTFDRIRNGSTSPYKAVDTLLRNTTFQYADPVRVSAALNRNGAKDTVIATYSGLGYLTNLNFSRPYNPDWGVLTRDEIGESYTYDPMGNTASTWRSAVDSNLSGDFWWTSGNGWSNFQSGTGRATSTGDIGGSYAFVYDSAGNTVFVYQYGSGPTLRDRASFYGADGRLRVAESRQVSFGYWGMAFEEYRYDALGRRVLVMDRQRCISVESSKTWCNQSRVRRTVWDGPRELWEIQMPARTEDSLLVENDTAAVAYWSGMDTQTGVYLDPNPLFGRLAYTYAGGLDRPVSIERVKLVRRKSLNEGFTNFPPVGLAPHWNWRGGADFGTFFDGGVKTCTDATHCVVTQWRQQGYGYAVVAEGWGASVDGAVQNGWFGTLIDGKQDKTGTQYRRNRSVDPTTGRFTQEDPIGLAGGLNLYGFANGDPVTFTDPFGLCPVAKDGIPCTIYSVNGADLSRLQAGTREQLLQIAEASGHDLGIGYATEGTHRDECHSKGCAVDINELDHSIDIGRNGHRTATPVARAAVADVESAARGNWSVYQVIGPDGFWGKPGTYDPRQSYPLVDTPRNGHLWFVHQSHIHISIFPDFITGHNTP